MVEEISAGAGTESRVRGQDAVYPAEIFNRHHKEPNLRLQATRSNSARGVMYSVGYLRG